MNAHMTKEEFNNLPIKEEIEFYPIPNQYYRDCKGGVGLAKFTDEKNHSRYFWDNFAVTFVDENGKRI